MEPMSDHHATDRPRAADAEPGAPAEPGPAVAHPVDWAFAARTARSLAAAGPRFTPREATREAEGLRAVVAPGAGRRAAVGAGEAGRRFHMNRLARRDA